MSLTQALSIALTGLRTSQQLIAVTSNNISNAQTAGYSTKSAVVASVDYNGQMGGSAVSNFLRAADQALTNNYNKATTGAGYSGTQNTYMTQVQAVLDSSDSNPTLSDDIAQFSAAWSDYASQPESATSQQAVLTAGNKLANDISTITSGIGSLRTQVQSDISSQATSFNAALKQVSVLNIQIQEAKGAGKSYVDLEDQRDAAINQISQYTNITIQPRANDQVAVYTPGGQMLVDGGNTISASYNGTSLIDNTGHDITPNMLGGSFQAAIDFVSNSPAALASTTPGVGTLTKLQNQISLLVDSFTNSSGTTPSAFATAYSSAVTTSTAATGTQSGQTLVSSFFTVSNNASGNPDASTFAVNASLLNGVSAMPRMNASGIVASFEATQDYTTTGLTSKSSTYAQLGTAILSGAQSQANIIKTANTTATGLKTYYNTQITNSTGVNLDTELANLTTYQNSYAAAAHIISTVNQMMQTLMDTIT